MSTINRFGKTLEECLGITEARMDEIVGRTEFLAGYRVETSYKSEQIEMLLDVLELEDLTPVEKAAILQYSSRFDKDHIKHNMQLEVLKALFGERLGSKRIPHHAGFQFGAEHVYEAIGMDKEEYNEAEAAVLKAMEEFKDTVKEQEAAGANGNALEIELLVKVITLDKSNLFKAVALFHYLEAVYIFELQKAGVPLPGQFVEVAAGSSAEPGEPEGFGLDPLGLGLGLIGTSSKRVH